MIKIFNFFYRIKPIYRLTKNYHLEQKYLHNGVLKIADEILDEKKNCLEKNNEFSENEQDGSNNKKSKSFIKIITDPKNNLSYEEMKDEINNFIAAVREKKAQKYENII